MTARLGLISGYLGAGKSTLVNRLLAGGPLGRTAVVVNDFGSVNIDADLVVSASEDTIELTNGCICCQITDDVARTMSALAARTDLEQVLCEVSGVGDPRQLATWQHFPGFAPGPVLVCADATAVGALLRDEYVGDTVQRQLSAADVVLVTKTDLAGSVRTEEAVRACRLVAPGAHVVPQDPSDPGATAVHAFTHAPERPAAPEPGSGLGKPDHHARTHVSLTLENLGPVDVDALAHALTRQTELLVRAKGVVRDAAGRWHHLHLSSGRVDRRAHPAGRPPPARDALVLIAAGPAAKQSLATAAAELTRPALSPRPGMP